MNDLKYKMKTLVCTEPGKLEYRTRQIPELQKGQTMIKNANPFYQTEETAAAIVSSKASIAPPQLKETVLYDIATQAGKTYT
jgi:alpha-L-fucosidase 2